MKYWVYKCNARPREDHWRWGDWEKDDECGLAPFSPQGYGEPVPWGSTDSKGGGEVEEGDTIIAYQTNSEKLIGVAIVESISNPDPDQSLVLRAIEPLGVSVPRLKGKHERIANLPAFRQGRIATFYPIEPDEARFLIEAAQEAMVTELPPRHGLRGTDRAAPR